MFAFLLFVTRFITNGLMSSWSSELVFYKFKARCVQIKRQTNRILELPPLKASPTSPATLARRSRSCRKNTMLSCHSPSTLLSKVRAKSQLKILPHPWLSCPSESWMIAVEDSITLQTRQFLIMEKFKALRQIRAQAMKSLIRFLNFQIIPMHLGHLGELMMIPQSRHLAMWGSKVATCEKVEWRLFTSDLTRTAPTR